MQQKGCKVFRVGDADGRLDLDEVLKVLAEQGITRLMVEGGPTVAGAIAAADLVDEAVLLRGEKSIGADGIEPLEGMPLDALTGQLHARGSEKLGPDTLEMFERALMMLRPHQSPLVPAKAGTQGDMAVTLCSWLWIPACAGMNGDVSLMFTGIVTDVGEVRSVKPRADNLHRITIACGYPRAELIEGASIACSGVCLTVVGHRRGGRPHLVRGRCGGRDLARHHRRPLAARQPRQSGALAQARRRTGRPSGRRPCRRPGHRDRARGHDRHGALRACARRAALARFIAPKGSVALDGVSLTVNAVEGDTFSVLIIPHTLQVTTFGALRKGDDVNLEIDTMARYAARLMEAE